MKKRGFTLIECAIVVLVIAILIGIAVPQFLRSRSQSQAKSCTSTLRQIAEAKELWAIANHKPADAPCDMAQLVPDFIRRTPICPGAGSYLVGALDETPTCSLGSLSVFPHRL